MTKVLVVDDERDGADGLAMILESWGHRAATAYNGIEALAVAGRFEPEVVILDIDMPLMDGFQAARALRDRGTPERPFLVALTAWAGDDVVGCTKACGFDVYMAKPADLELLRAIIERPRLDPNRGRTDLK